LLFCTTDMMAHDQEGRRLQVRFETGVGRRRGQNRTLPQMP
jgi:hypothetical protein